MHQAPPVNYHGLNTRRKSKGLTVRRDHTDDNLMIDHPQFDITEFTKETPNYSMHLMDNTERRQSIGLTPLPINGRRRSGISNDTPWTAGRPVTEVTEELSPYTHKTAKTSRPDSSTSELYNKLKAYCQASMQIAEEVDKRRLKQKQQFAKKDRENSVKETERTKWIKSLKSQLEERNAEVVKLRENWNFEKKEHAKQKGIAKSLLQENVNQKETAVELKIKLATGECALKSSSEENKKLTTHLDEHKSRIIALEETVSASENRFGQCEVRADGLQTELTQARLDIKILEDKNQRNEEKHRKEIAECESQHRKEIAEWQERYRELEQEENDMVNLLLKRSNKRKEARLSGRSFQESKRIKIEDNTTII